MVSYDLDAREIALQYAVKFHEGHTQSADYVIDTARKFEAYLTDANAPIEHVGEGPKQYAS
jgi:hypothetical protein